MSARIAAPGVRSPLLALLLLAALPVCSFAQPAALAGGVEIAVGVQWTGELSNGTQGAFETTPGNSRYALFQTRTALAPATGLEGSFSKRIARSVDVRGIISYARPDLRTTISSDVEGIPDIAASEAATQLTVEGGLVVRVPRWRITDRTTPFVSGGGGYLRHLHEGRTLIENGMTFHLGGGLDYLLKTSGRGAAKVTGLRAEVRSVWRRGGVAFDDGAHVSPAFGASFFARF